MWCSAGADEDVVGAVGVALDEVVGERDEGDEASLRRDHRAATVAVALGPARADAHPLGRALQPVERRPRAPAKIMAVAGAPRARARAGPPATAPDRRSVRAPAIPCCLAATVGADPSPAALKSAPC